MTYQCPICQLTLSQTETNLKCENNHQFDVAKEGYVNLMPANHKRSKLPGDSMEMMQARRRFLELGHYSPLSSRVSTICADAVTSDVPSLLDIGCGEGYYTNQVSSKLRQQYKDSSTYGLDIAKVAIRYAAKRHPNCLFSVASSHRLPFSDGSLGAILRIYAPCKESELNRCLASGGALITVTPAARHLLQLRERIYQEVRLHDEMPEQIDGFELELEENIHYTMSLKQGAALDLLQMTPFAWKASENLKQELKSAENFNCEADFMVRVYRKR